MIGNKKDACQLHIWYICMYFILATHRTTNTINFWQVITVYWDRCFIITYMQHLQLAVTALWCDWCLVKGYWNQSFCVYMKLDVCFVRLFDVLCTSVCCSYDGDDDNEGNFSRPNVVTFVRDCVPWLVLIPYVFELNVLLLCMFVYCWLNYRNVHVQKFSFLFQF